MKKGNIADKVACARQEKQRRIYGHTINKKGHTNER